MKTMKCQGYTGDKSGDKSNTYLTRVHVSLHMYYMLSTFWKMIHMYMYMHRMCVTVWISFP
jgi:hypothetical protein